MAAVLGLNAVFHDPAAALVIDGEVVAAAEEERFSRRKHGKECVPFSTWELPTQSMRWCLEHAGLDPSQLDAVAYSYDPQLCTDAPPAMDVDMTPFVLPRSSWDPWESLRTMFARRSEEFVRDHLPGVRSRFVHVPHHVAHAASAHLCAPFDECAVLVLDGRGEVSSHLAGHARRQRLTTVASQRLPHSIGLLYEEVTDHLGFRRSSDEFKVMALASYGDPARFGPVFTSAVRGAADGGFSAHRLDLDALVPRRHPDEDWTDAHADLAAAVQHSTECLMLDLGWWVHQRTGSRNLAMAGGVALNCVANAKLANDGPFRSIWVQPAAGDSGTALGAALHVAADLGDTCRPFTTAALGRGWSESAIRAELERADLAFEQPADLVGAAADVLAANGVVGWFEGRSEFGPRALGHRSLLVDPRRPENLQRMNAIKGREDFRPVAPVVLLERASQIFSGVIPSPYMLFVHDVLPEWRDRIPAAVHVDGTARIQTVDRRDEPLLADLLDAFEARTGCPVLINTSFNTAGRPMVDSPVDAMECFGSGPIDLLVLAPFVVRRHALR